MARMLSMVVVAVVALIAIVAWTGLYILGAVLEVATHASVSAVGLVKKAGRPSGRWLVLHRSHGPAV